MKVRIKGDISGSRNGVPWPKRGEVMELPDEEAAGLCGSGLAVPAAGDEADAEQAVPDEADVERRTGGLTTETAGALTQSPADEDGQGDAQTESAETRPAPARKTTAKKTAAKTQGASR